MSDIDMSKKRQIEHIKPVSNAQMELMNNSFATIYSLEEYFSEPISLCHLGWQLCPPGYTVGPAIRDLYLIHYVRKGRGSLVVDPKTYNLREGDSFLIYPDEITTYMSDTNEPWSYVFFALRGKAAATLIESVGFSRENRVLSIQNDKIAEIIYNAIQQLYQCTTPYWFGLTTLTSLLTIYAEKNVSPDRQKVPPRGYAARAKDYIDFNYSTKISMEELASLLSICRTHLYRTFKASYGMAPNVYLVQKRLDFASHLLIDSTLPVDQIAELSGFSAYSAFFRLFKIRYGMSPREYREEKHKEKKPAE